MLAKRIIPCLDVKKSQVVNGVSFCDRFVIDNIIELAKRYCQEGADELVFYDSTAANSEGQRVDYDWIAQMAAVINIPFCVASAIRNIEQAEMILAAGADKISINFPALENPELITTLANRFGTQCIVVGIDSYEENNDYYVYRYTGDGRKIESTHKRTLSWIAEVAERGAGEVILNCINRAGARGGYDIQQLKQMRSIINIPLIASGGAGSPTHFTEVFNQANVDGALAIGVFHTQKIMIDDLKQYLKQQNITMRV